MEVSPATYGAHENGTRGFGDIVAATYARRFGVSKEWLVFGGEHEGAPKRVDNGDTPPADAALVSVHNVAASAGPGAIALDDEGPAYQLAFPPDYLRKVAPSASPRDLAIIEVKGESMIPTLHDDDIVMLDRGKTSLDYDGLFVLRFGETLHVKRVTRSPKADHIKILSDNRDLYPPEEWHKAEVQVIGKVVWKGGKA